jgi:hypothetical protein
MCSRHFTVMKKGLGEGKINPDVRELHYETYIQQAGALGSVIG